MTKPSSKPDIPVLAIEKTPKGRSMWEILLQLRVLLPYLTRMAPLLEPLVDRLAHRQPEINGLSDNITAIHTTSRDLEVQARNQALQLERIEEQLARLRASLEANSEENRALAAELRSARKRLTLFAASILVLLLVLAGMVAFLLTRA